MKKYILGLLFLVPSACYAGFRSDSITAVSTFTLSGSTVVLNGTTYFWMAGSGSNGQALKTDGATRPVLTWGAAGGGSSVDTSSFSWVLIPKSAILSTNTCTISLSSAAMTSSLLCDDTNTPFITWEGFMDVYHGRGLNAYVVFSATGATSGTAEFNGQLMCVSPLDQSPIDTQSYAAYTSSAVTVPGTAGYPSSARWSLTDDSCSQGDLIIFRLHVNAAGTAPGQMAIRPSWIYEP